MKATKNITYQHPRHLKASNGTHRAIKIQIMYFLQLFLLETSKKMFIPQYKAESALLKIEEQGASYEWCQMWKDLLEVIPEVTVYGLL
jgi:hypothetical protein